MYAHTIARMLDPDGKLFAYRIRSRDECFNAFSKSHDMRSVQNNRQLLDEVFVISGIIKVDIRVISQAEGHQG